MRYSKIYYFQLIVWAVVSAVNMGCSRSEEAIPSQGISDKGLVGIYALPASAVLFSINGQAVTKKDFDVLQSLHGKLARMHWGLSLAGSNPRADRYVHNREQKSPEELFRRELLRQEAERLGVVVSDAQMTEKFEEMKKYLKRPNARSLKDIADELGNGEGQMFLDFVCGDVRDELLRHHVATNGQFDVTEAEVSERLKDIADFNMRADASNALQRAKAENALSRVRGGESFSNVAMRVSEVHPEFGIKWETLEPGEIQEDQPLRKWLDRKPAVGDVSDPMDLDDGLAVVKVLAKNRISDEDDEDVVEEYDLARMTFLAYEYFPVETADVARKSILDYKRKQIQSLLYSNLCQRAKIEFPNGRNFFPRESK